ncbi:hypothetical protein [Pseudarthrobacter sp. AB1]|uniref:hypothetical protein n=1 Tax=Pseudarthrobacter sp. AB1 TaxID=2138309 RepID=UPI00186B6C88|nr:hypothetical protein [Pseudarthrobacter sp. AB1]
MPLRPLTGRRGGKPGDGVLEAAGQELAPLANPDVGVDACLEVITVREYLPDSYGP